MLVSVSSWSYRKWFDSGKLDLSGFVEEVARLGADGFEIFPQHVADDDPEACLCQTAEQAAAAGLQISSLIAGNNFARPSIAARAEQVQLMQQKIHWAAKAGIDRLNTFTGYHMAGEPPILEFHRVVDCYREVMPAAAEHGVLLCVENHSSVCSDADGLMALIHAVDSPWLRTNPDPSNFVPDFTVRSERAREPIYEQTARIMPLAANAHLKIADFTEEGEHAAMDVGRLVGIWQQYAYNGHVVLEVYGDAEHPDETCAKGIALLHRHLA